MTEPVTRRMVMGSMARDPVTWLDLGGIILFSYLLITLVPEGNNPIMVLMFAVGILLIVLSVYVRYELARMRILIRRKIEHLDKLSAEMNLLMRKMSGTLNQTNALSNDDFQ